MSVRAGSSTILTCVHRRVFTCVAVFVWVWVRERERKRVGGLGRGGLRSKQSPY